MKKYFPLILIFSLCFISSYSQTEQGRFVVSGATNIQFLFSNSDPHSTSVVDSRERVQDFGVNAGLGYFIIDNLALGITGFYNYAYSKKKIFLDPVYEEDIQRTVAIIPSITYFFPLEGNLRPTLSLGAGYVSLEERNNQSATPENIVYHYGGISLNAGVGLSYFLTSSVALDLGFQYSRNKLNDKTNDRRSQLQKNYGLGAGISFYF